MADDQTLSGSLDRSDLRVRFGTNMCPSSLVVSDTTALWLQSTAGDKRLAVLTPSGHAWLALFHGESEPFSKNHVLRLCPADHANAQALQDALPYLRPMPLGLATSAGFGDRLGLATPGHVRTLHAVMRELGTRPITPIFAQQSVREMARTRRSPADVTSDATWGAFQEGWTGTVGADADHLKSPDDIDACVAARFSFFTIDPGEFVDTEAETASPDVVERKVAALRWDDLESSPEDLRKRYEGHGFELENRRVLLDGESVWRAAAKYGNAIAQVTTMYRYLAATGAAFELEVSVDETDTPTTHAQHLIVDSELRRLGVHWASLAPRFVGSFEKGVDYIGDLRAFERDLLGHVEIASALGPYKLSLHSGSDKFSVYPLVVSATEGLVHLKTAGTSYVEALRVVAAVEPPLFRDLFRLACVRYPVDRASYHVSAELTRLPDLDGLADSELPILLDHADARQVLHATFGSVLSDHREAIRAVMSTHEDEHYRALERHFVRHLEPFAQPI